MAYTFSSPNDANKVATLVQEEINESSEKERISSHLQLKSSTSKTLEKDAVLRRIRRHERLNRVRGACQALLMGSDGDTDMASAYNMFSAP